MKLTFSFLAALFLAPMALMAAEPGDAGPSTGSGRTLTVPEPKT
jgi:hypothetical protein